MASIFEQYPYNNSVLFDQNDLSKIPGIMIYDYKVNALPKRTLNINKLSRQDKSILTSAEFTDKEIVVYFMLRDCSKDEMEAILRQLKGLLVQKNRTLTVWNAGVAINYTATLSDIPEPTWTGQYLTSYMLFECSDPIGYEGTATTLVSATNTLASNIYSADVGGSYTAEPRFEMTFTAATGGTGKTVSITNATIGQGITVTGNFVAGTTLVVDSSTKEVTIDAVQQDFSGIFPYFYPGSTSIGYNDTLTTRTVKINVTYNKRNI